MHFLLGSKTEGRREIRPLFICPQSPGLGGCPQLQQRMHFSVWWWFKCPIFYLILMAGKRYAAVTWYCFFLERSFLGGGASSFVMLVNLCGNDKWTQFFTERGEHSPKKLSRSVIKAKLHPVAVAPAKRGEAGKKVTEIIQ